MPSYQTQRKSVKSHRQRGMEMTGRKGQHCDPLQEMLILHVQKRHCHFRLQG